MRSLSRSPIAHRRQRRQEIKKQLQKEKEQRERQQKEEEEEAGGNAGVSMETSGKLLEDTNVVNGVVVKYSEPREARKPKTKWRLYVFKVCHGILISPDFSTLSSLLLTLDFLICPLQGEEELPILYIHRQSCYLLGRDRKVAGIPLDHPSCSKQHAVLQYRMVDMTRSDGSKGK